MTKPTRSQNQNSGDGVMNWKLSKDAPKDRPVLVYTAQGNQYVGTWCKDLSTDDEAFYIMEFSEGEKLIVKATHYMELPLPPEFDEVE